MFIDYMQIQYYTFLYMSLGHAPILVSGCGLGVREPIPHKCRKMTIHKCGMPGSHGASMFTF